METVLSIGIIFVLIIITWVVCITYVNYKLEDILKSHDASISSLINARHHIMIKEVNNIMSTVKEVNNTVTEIRYTQLNRWLRALAKNGIKKESVKTRIIEDMEKAKYDYIKNKKKEK